MLTGRKLVLTLAFTVLVALAFGVSCKGFFVSPVLTAISVGPTGQNVQQGDTLQMSARGTYDIQNPQNITGKVLWSSDNLAVATVTQGGLVTGVSAPGTANISASLDTLTGSASVTVVLTGVTKIAITPQNINVKQGAMQNFTCAATVTGQPNPVDITASTAWTTTDTTNTSITTGSNPAVLTVNNGATLNEMVTVTATYTVGTTVFTNTATSRHCPVTSSYRDCPTPAPLIAFFAMSGCRERSRSRHLIRHPLHHKTSVCAITDSETAVYDNDNRLGIARSAPGLQRRPANPLKSRFGTLFDNEAQQNHRQVIGSQRL